MTVGMQMMNQMFRDFKVAQDVGKMMELRRFEIEFELFGTVYWENQQRHYLISRNENTLYQQLLKLELQGKYPLLLQVYTERSLVPAGTEEEIEQQMKIKFAKRLQMKYPEVLWKNISQLTEHVENDAGKLILDPLQEQLTGLFQEPYLQLFADLLKLVYLRKNLTQRSFCAYQDWLKEERQEMIEQSNTQDIFSKNFFGIAYRDKTGGITNHVNASRQIIANKKMKLELTEGCLVAPIYEQKCWYNYEYRLAQARQDFQRRLQRLYNEQYFIILEKLQALPIVIDEKTYLQHYTLFASQGLTAIWQYFGQQWGIRVGLL